MKAALSFGFALSDPRKLIYVSMLILMAKVAISAGAATTATWDGGTINWSDASHWSTKPVYPNNSAGTTY